MHTIKPLTIIEGVEIDKSFMTYLTLIGKKGTIDGYIWYIEGPQEKIIVDTGIGTEAFEHMKMISPKSTPQLYTPQEALARVGLKPEEIDIVILTHLHFDHVDQGALYTNARFIVQKDELEYALNPHPSQGLFFDRKSFEKLNFEVVDGDREIVPGVSVLLTPGHTNGSQSVLVETAQGKAIISGLCTIRENYDPPEKLRHPLPVITPAIHKDPIQAYESVLRIKQMADVIFPLQEPGLGVST